MATLLRPPLVSQTQKRKLGSVDSWPNLLATTLAILPALNIPLRSGRTSDSAPAIRAQLRIDQQLIRPLTLGIPLATLTQPLLTKNWQDGASIKKKSQTQIDFYPNLLATTLKPSSDTTNLPAMADMDGVNERPRYVRVDIYPNLLANTLAPVSTIPLPLSALRWDWSAPQVKRNIQAEQGQNTVVKQPVPWIQRLEATEQRKYQVWNLQFPPLLQTTLAPAGVPLPLPLSASRMDQSAPRIKYRDQIDQPSIRSITLNPIPAIQALYDSAPHIKYRPQIDIYPNTVAVGINPNARPIGLIDSAPPPKYKVQLDAYANLSISTLLPIPANSDSQQTVTVNASVSITVFGPATTTVNG